MSSRQVFEQSIEIQANLTTVERCFTQLDLMHQWLNPLLECQPVGMWSTEMGSQSRFMIKIPLIQPTLQSTVIERKPGLVVWQFEGFFQGCDRWECQPTDSGTHLINRFEFEIPNPLIQFGFKTFAATWTQEDMKAQLRRLQQVAESNRE
ncbi:MAG: SRPBCC family protein [Roseofilum sp. SBFL]|uniref:SRPBCC family protein n=1 Tax=unclassified Roseofilum TaxID=2620099 RepID=UPI001B245541|nr:MULTISPECIES: SRPBCC family protein [unclassified Roseofilum]MBP0023532.1 SRPBCC family protein [Roseofilum sp. SID2]MBP0039640.1 SRPBCC family protein [Roseofilum sp. SID1]MBP0043559.1 SRPBCC family protein [Roseofilum sp. SBFL]